jgi:hypothetical protein
MTGHTSGLERDLRLVRRRAWLFIPFFFLGLLVAFAFGSLAGKSNSVATIQLETVVHQVFAGGDRGFRIFEAEAMTKSQPFKDKVIAATGDPKFDYARYTISLAAIAVGDGVASGTLTVSVRDDDKATADRLRKAFVDVFTHEYTAQDGLFRTGFVASRAEVAAAAEQQYQAAYTNLKTLAQAKSITAPLDQIALHRRDGGLAEQLSRTEADLQAQLAEVQGAIKAVSGSGVNAEVAAAIASSVLKTPVASVNAPGVLAAKEQALVGAITALRQQRASFADGAFDAEFLSALDRVRGLDQLKEDAHGRLVDTQAAVVSAESSAEPTYSASGGLAGSTGGKGAVVIAVTIVFGLIAIYTLEWLSQIRRGAQD